MFNLKSKQACREIETLFQEIQINLENNYKDLAIDARKTAERRLEELREEGTMIEKHYAKLKKELDVFKERMVGYHH